MEETKIDYEALFHLADKTIKKYLKFLKETFLCLQKICMSFPE